MFLIDFFKGRINQYFGMLTHFGCVGPGLRSESKQYFEYCKSKRKNRNPFVSSISRR